MKPMIQLISPTTKPHSRVLIFLPPILPRTLSQMKTFFALFLSSLLLFSCGTDEPRRPQDALHAAAEAYPLVTETQNDDFSPVVWRVPLIPRQLLTATQDSSRWLKLPPTEKNMVSFDIWTEGETVNPHQRQKATFVKEFQTATNAEFRTTPILCGIKQLNVYGVTDEKSVLLNHNVRIHLPTFIKLPLRFEYEGVEGYHIICVSDSISHNGDQTIEQANDGALDELRPALRFHLPKTLADQFKYLKVEFELIDNQKLEALIAPTLLF
jgi:hypothetical protein